MGTQHIPLAAASLRGGAVSPSALPHPWSGVAVRRVGAGCGGRSALAHPGAAAVPGCSPPGPWCQPGMGGWRDAGTQGWRDMGMEELADARTQGSSDAGVGGCRDAGTQGWRDASVEGCADSGTLGCRNAGMCRFRDGVMQERRDAGTEEGRMRGRGCGARGPSPAASPSGSAFPAGSVVPPPGPTPPLHRTRHPPVPRAGSCPPGRAAAKAPQPRRGRVLLPREHPESGTPPGAPTPRVPEPPGAAGRCRTVTPSPTGWERGRGVNRGGRAGIGVE